jgi:hypothetical protein
MKARSTGAPEACAVCGTDLSPSAKACPECGADERTGWRESLVYDGIDLPEDEALPAARSQSKTGGLPWYWLAVSLVLLLLLGLSVLGLR